MAAGAAHTLARGHVSIAQLGPDAQRQVAAVYDLPNPPSVNHLFQNVRNIGRVPTKDYKAWKKEAGLCVLAQRGSQPKIPGGYELQIISGHRKCDLGNIEKAVSDLLVEMRVVVDDRLAQRIVLEWGDVTGCRVVISPWRGGITVELA